MRSTLPWGWIALAAFLLLLPGPAGRLLLDLLGGVTLLVLLLPLLAGGAALVGWQLLRRRLRTCPACGFSSLGSDLCPACGCSLADVASHSSAASPDPDPRSATITVDATAVVDSSDGPSKS
ncbi:MAG: hypothetical protein ACKOZT_10915 [Cyanobium sp.]